MGFSLALLESKSIQTRQTTFSAVSFKQSVCGPRAADRGGFHGITRFEQRANPLVLLAVAGKHLGANQLPIRRIEPQLNLAAVIHGRSQYLERVRALAQVNMI
jgi:hypothetical protein